MTYYFYKVKADEIYLIKSILEAYENMMDISTIDKSVTKIQVTIATDFLEEAKAILEDLGTKFMMIKLDEPDNVSQGNY